MKSENQTNLPNLFADIDEVAFFLKCAPKTIRNKIWKKTFPIPHTNDDGKLLFARTALIAHAKKLYDEMGIVFCDSYSTAPAARGRGRPRLSSNINK